MRPFAALAGIWTLTAFINAGLAKSNGTEDERQILACIGVFGGLYAAMKVSEGSHPRRPRAEAQAPGEVRERPSPTGPDRARV